MTVVWYLIKVRVCCQFIKSVTKSLTYGLTMSSNEIIMQRKWFQISIFQSELQMSNIRHTFLCTLSALTLFSIYKFEFTFTTHFIRNTQNTEIKHIYTASIHCCMFLWRCLISSSTVFHLNTSEKIICFIKSSRTIQFDTSNQINYETNIKH